MNSGAAVVLLSGGMDSVTAAAYACRRFTRVYGLCVDYGQRHRAELDCSQRQAKRLGLFRWRSLRIDLAGYGGSALTDPDIAIPPAGGSGIPVTYVPARNTVLLSLALAWGEVLAARDIFIGVNAVDYSGYPDCRPPFISAFEQLANLATKAGVEGERWHIHAPLMQLKKADIIRLGMSLGIDYRDTVSCYQADEQGRACGCCDACSLRRQGFLESDIADPTHYMKMVL